MPLSVVYLRHQGGNSHCLGMGRLQDQKYWQNPYSHLIRMFWSFLDQIFQIKLFIFSCLALNDLLRGRPLDDIIDKLPEIWETLFRVQDDIKVL